MCLLCGQEVHFFAGVPTGRFALGSFAFDTSANYAPYVFDGSWQALGTAFTGGFQSNGGTIAADYQAVNFFNGVPTGGAPQGQIAFDISVSPYPMYVFSGGWQLIGTSSAAAADLLAVCGPNVMFGPSSPPPAPTNPPPKGTIFIPTNGETPYVFYPPGGGDGWQPIGLGSVPVMNRVFLTDNTLTSWTAPAGFNPLDNKIEIVAHGGTGADGTTAPAGGGGGGGGGYAYKINANINPGDTVAVVFSLIVGNTVSIEDSTAAICCEATWGAPGVGPTGGAGGTFTVGDGGFTGGAGGNAAGSGGGGAGGAAGPTGNGAAGGESLSNSGGGGGGANGGSNGGLGGAGAGGNGGPGTGAGSVGGTGSLYPPPVIDGGNGTGGGGGGGAGGGVNAAPGGFGGGGGSFGDNYWDPANYGCTGGGGGGAGCDTTTPGGPSSPGGTGFNGYGGGGGGSGGSALGTPGDNVGAPGQIVITWTT